jgi:selenocysteine-specific elongation factor
VRRVELLRKSRFSAMEIAEAANELARGGRLMLAGDWAVEAGWWNELRRGAIEAIDAKHRAQPNDAGLALGELRALVTPKLPAPEIFEALVADLCRADFAQAGAVIQRRTHRPKLPPQLEAAAVRLRATLAAKLFDPPSRKELAPDTTSQQALRFLLQCGEAVEIGPEVVLLAAAYARATEQIRQLITQSGPATVSEIRQVLGSSRRVVVPLVEKLDREGVTRRDGDRRVLGAKK